MARRTEIERLLVRMEADVQKYKRDLDKNVQQTKLFGGRIQRILKRTGGFFSFLTKGVFGFKAALAGVVGIGGLGYFIKRNLDTIDTLTKTASRLGLTVQELSSLQHVANLTGVATNTFNLALQRMVRRVTEASNGTGEAVGALKDLGLEATELANLSPDEQFRRIADAMKAIPTQGERVRLSFKLFDSEGVALVNTLKLGADGIREAQDEAVKLGLTMSNKAAKGVEEANDALDRLKALLTGASHSFTAALAPAINTVVTKVRVWLQETAKAEGGFGGLGAKLANNFIDATVKILSAFETLSNGVLNTFTDIQVAGRKIGLFPKEQESRLVKAARRVRELRNEIGILQVDVDSADISGPFAEHFEDVDVEATKQKINELSSLLKGANSEFYKLAELEGLAGVDPDKVLEPFKISLLGIKQSLLNSKIKVSDIVETQGDTSVSLNKTIVNTTKTDQAGDSLDTISEKIAKEIELERQKVLTLEQIQDEQRQKTLEKIAEFEAAKDEVMQEITDRRAEIEIELKQVKTDEETLELQAEQDSLIAQETALQEIRNQFREYQASQEKLFALQKQDAAKKTADEIIKQEDRILAAKQKVNASLAKFVTEKLGIESKYVSAALQLRAAHFDKDKQADIAEIKAKIPKTAMKAYDALAGIPIVGPVLGAAAAGAVYAYGALQVAEISGVSLFADGGVFDGGRLVNSPEAFSFNGGQVGLRGEAGTEAILPLERKNGVLGVRADFPQLPEISGTSSSGVTVNVIESDGDENRVEQSNDENGNEVIDVFIREIREAFTSDVNEGGNSFTNALEGAYPSLRRGG